MQLQLALDHPAALACVAHVAPEVDLIEAGTPLIKRFGLSVLASLRELAPRPTLVADAKIADGGAGEARMFYGAGADIVTVLASASSRTIAAAADVAGELGRGLVLDTVGADDPVALMDARPLPSGVTHIAVHASLDDRTRDPHAAATVFDDARRAARFGRPVVVAGGITSDTITDARNSGAAIAIVGRAIWASSDPLAAVRRLREVLSQ